MAFGFQSGRRPTDAIFILCHIQEKHLTEHKVLYFVFVGFEKAFVTESPERFCSGLCRNLAL